MEAKEGAVFESGEYKYTVGKVAPVTFTSLHFTGVQHAISGKTFFRVTEVKGTRVMGWKMKRDGTISREPVIFDAYEVEVYAVSKKLIPGDMN